MHRCAYSLDSYGHSDVGLIRSNNEDVYLKLMEYNFFALADGMGGHKAGEVAAQETVVYLSNCIDKMFRMRRNTPLDIYTIKEQISLFIEHSNTRIYQLGKENASLNGMGTTLCSLLFYNDKLIRAHVGDSRIYLWRDHELSQLTYDHTLENKLMSQGRLEEALKKGTRVKNVLTKAIGAYQKLSPEISLSRVSPGDLYLMCSDGLSDYVTDEEISCIIKDSTTLKEMAHRLIFTAKSKKSSDNITVLLTQVE